MDEARNNTLPEGHGQQHKKASFVGGGEKYDGETVLNGRAKRRRKTRFLYVYVSAEPVDLVGQSV